MSTRTCVGCYLNWTTKDHEGQYTKYHQSAQWIYSKPGGRMVSWRQETSSALVFVKWHLASNPRRGEYEWHPTLFNCQGDMGLRTTSCKESEMIKRNELQLCMEKYESFAMIFGETVQEMENRFNVILSEMRGLERTIHVLSWTRRYSVTWLLNVLI